MDFRLDHRRYALSFRRTIRTARGAWDVREGLYVRLERPDGTVGFGEASPVPGFGSESLAEAEQQCQALAGPVAAGKLAAIPGRLGSLRGALAAAMASPGPAPARSLAVAALLPAGRAALEEAPGRAEAGFRVFKWKVGVGAADDEMAMLDDLLAALPSGSKLRLDANGAWHRRAAEQWLARASERPVEFVEQPVPADGKGARDLLLGLAGDYPVPIGLDESVVDQGDVGRWLDDGWPGYYIIKPSLLGDAAATVARLAAADARVVFSSALETVVGAQAALRLAFAWTGRPSALGFGVWPLFADSRFDGPTAMPFLHSDELHRADPASLWNAVS